MEPPSDRMIGDEPTRVAVREDIESAMVQGDENSAAANEK
jgi:hypothetical protein